MTSATHQEIRAWAADQGIECPRHGSVPRRIVDQYNAVHRASTDGAWRESAACLDEDPELFFPIGEGGKFQQQIEEAKWICSLCDVREECLAFAVERPQLGIWGGADEDERKSIRRRASRKRVSA